MYYTVLPQRGLAGITGEDARPFLQGQVTNDVSRLAGEGQLYAALLTPQGKFLHDFFLIAKENGFWLDGVAEDIPALLEHLNRYRLRAKVEFSALPGQGVVALWGEGDASGVGRPDPRLAALGWRAAGDIAAIAEACRARGMQQATPEDYERLRIELGVPDGGRDMLPGKSLLLEYGFEALQGVDFNKGCYVGQEVTARSKHRGQLRRHLYRLHGERPLPSAPASIYRGDEQVGETTSSCGAEALATLRHEDVEKARHGPLPLRCGDAEVEAFLPAWVTVR